MPELQLPKVLPSHLSRPDAFLCIFFVPYDSGSFVSCAVEFETPDLRCTADLGAQSSMDPMSTDMPGDEYYDDDMPDLPDDDDY